MKKIIFTLALLTCLNIVNAQIVSGLKPPADGKMEAFTEWVKSDVTFDDNTTAVVEYRIALVNRKGIACHYNVEVKNNSDLKLKIRLKSSYYDKLVKGNYGDEIKETLKPGKTLAGRMIAQGCKKEKGTETDDYGHCMACDFGVSIYVSK
jgi:hypothetical protein